jgi:bifunctional non-homologous end joining protein LigD
MWSRTGNEWTRRLPELAYLSWLDNVVIDAEIVVAAPGGRADFDLLGARLNGRSGTPRATFYVFDILRAGVTELIDRPWNERRKWLEGLDLHDLSGGVARRTVWSLDGRAIHRARREIGAEGTVSKRLNSRYRPGQRSRAWLKAKHRHGGLFQVAGWRPSSPRRPGGLILAENGEFVGVATIALTDPQRSALVEMLRSLGDQHPSGAVTIPADCVAATVSFTARTPTYGR